MSEEKAKEVVEIQPETAIQVVDTPLLAPVSLRQKVEFMHEAAGLLLEIVKQQPNWVFHSEGREILSFNAWQTLGHFFGLVTAFDRYEEVQDKDGNVIGYRAHVYVMDRTGRIVSEAWAQADRNETIRGRSRFEGRPDQFVLAMAETRARRRALQGILASVIALAGYQPEVAEEVLEEASAPESLEEEDEPITQKDWGYFWAKVKEWGLTREDVHKLLGVSSVTEVVKTKTQLAAVLKRIYKEVRR